MFKNLREFILSMPDEKQCRDYLASQLWPDGIVICPYCGCNKVYRIKERDRFICSSKQCGKKFSVTVGTFFQDSKLSLHKWLTAVYLCSAHKKGISSYQLGKDIGVSQKTAWFMLHRIREAFKEKAPQMLAGTIESDETYMTRKYRSDYKGLSEEQIDQIRKNNYSKRNRGAVIGMVNRETGKIIVKAFDENTSENIASMVRDNVQAGSKLYTDESRIYHSLENDYQRSKVNHSRREWVIGEVHTNNVENFWSIMKRGIFGIYHHVSFKHLQAYCSEFSLRYNTRKMKDADRFTLTLRNLQGRLTYNQLVYGQETKPQKDNSQKEE